MAESSPKSEDTDSPVLSYSMALREGKRIVAKLAELMATPIADIEQPSLVDFTLSSSLASTPGGSGDDVPRRELFKSPAGQDGGAVCLLDTSNPESSPFGSAASLTRALGKLHMGDRRNGRPDGVPNHPASSDSTGSAPSSEPKHGGDSVNGRGPLFDAHELSLLESRIDGVVPTAATSSATPVEESPDPGRDTMPLVCFTPVVKPTRGFLAQSDPEVVVPDRLADEERLVVPCDTPLSFTGAKAVDRVEVDDAAATLPVPSDTAFGMRLSFAVVAAAEPAEADEAVAASSPDTRDSHAHSSDTAGEDSFQTAYESPVHSSRRSFVISRHEPLVSSNGVAAGDHDLPDSAFGDALASQELPKAAVVTETTFALPAPPTKPAAKPRVKASPTAAANATVVVAPRKPVSRPSGSPLATRKSLLPPPAASRRPERLAPPVKAGVSLGRPSGASKAAPRAAPRNAEETFAMNPATQVAPPACAPKVAPREQPKKQEQPSVRPKVPAPRGPVSARPASPASRQSMPAPGVASGAARRIAAGRRSVVTKKPVPQASSVAARPARPPTATITSAAASTKFPRQSAPTGQGQASKMRVTLPKPHRATEKPKPEPRGQPQAQRVQPSRSGIAAPRSRVAGGFSRLPTMAGSSADTRVALLPPVPESPGPTRVASTPLRADLPAPDKAVFPELTPIRRQ